MKFISAEEFLKQPKEVQKVFIDWWKPSIGDLFAWNYSDEKENDLHKLQCCTSELVMNLTKCNKGLKEGDRIPLLTEGQLREFIEYKDGEKIQFEYYFGKGYTILLFDPIGNPKMKYEALGDNLLQAYWKVACEIINYINKEDANR